MLEYGLESLIASSSSFTALASSRLYPLLLRTKDPLPAATYQRISTATLYTLTDRVNLTKCRMQFDTWATKYTDAKALMAAINDALDNYSGTLPNGVQVYGIQLYSCSDRYESDALLYRVTADYFIQYAHSS